ncbi:NAD(P)H-hydrate epimerase [Methanogenium cariaci]|uniref:NAD(P)H-hydrate epimerase n=1 Tax=Methanogenium cariaci TaxID=2197 RepID=UPI0024816696|nr:NAD(P)H-hydrate epimerase [Methanogenium cariaci]
MSVIIADTPPDAVRACRDRISAADVVIDAMLGTGITGALREPYATCVKVVRDVGVPVVAADTPTPGLPASVVCSFHRAKAGDPVVIEIGIPDEAEYFTGGPGDLLMVPQKGHASHKGGRAVRCWSSAAGPIRVRRISRAWRPSVRERISSGWQPHICSPVLISSSNRPKGG